jgi:MinD superfamily P-loop ATPase
MKEIVVLSGKGGVGKSTITASLGELFSEKHKVVMADTDVDTPNLALFFDAKLRNSEKIAASEKASIDYERCTCCLKCVDVCKFSSMTEYQNRPYVVSFSCEGCGACTVVCPEEAIEIKKVMNGEITIYDVDNTPLVSGQLAIGESSSGRIVDIVKRRARMEAKDLDAGLILTDGPPGIGCPVIASLKGSDYVIAVTEPTPTALHDLEKLFKVAQYFKTPFRIVINKADMHLRSKQEIKNFANKRSIIILAEIPYDNAVPKAIAQAKPVVSAYPDAESSRAIRNLADKLKKIVL